METSLFFGIIVTTVAGLVMGLSPTPLKFMRKFKYEQFGLISMALALFLIPWCITIIFCPHLDSVFREIDKGLLLRANVFSLCWGIAQVLAMLCFIRIGVSLTYGILCSIGAAIGIITPMIFKASGIFSTAPDIFSKPGFVVLAGVIVMIAGVYLASLAGFKREKQSQTEPSGTSPKTSGSFVVGLIMVIVAGILSAGWGFAFAYSQGPIIEIMKAHGAADFPSKIAVWAFVLFGAAVINVIYPAYLLTVNKSWNVIIKNGNEVMLSLLYGLLFCIPSLMLGKGMLLLGSLGASVGMGITLGSVIIGGQILGFASGEWKGVTGKPQQYIYSAVVVLVLSMIILALSNLISQQ
jgi:L-rhamnose-H+ transport protein